MRRLAYIIPIALFVVLTIFLFRSLIAPPPSELPSMLIDKPAPALSLPPLDANAQSFGVNDFKGHVTVLNVFASWCVPCREEAPALASLSSLKGVALYGMVYKDTPEKARAFLAEVGNPFARIALDADGRAGIDWGVYGVPETFVIDPRGIVRYRFAGGLDADSITAQLLPAIAQARQ
ncbi:MAG TPA: DsbE family thiol:disulfide interchange protein [Rhizomicrobium sp.]|nr:DsbE family thiol:disulfide interchange protein [Rhizomicrobium sp.]